MKRRLTKLMLPIFLVFLIQEVMAADYYFSTTAGNDSRTAVQAQNPNTPWKSIEKLNEIFASLKPGDAIYFKRGDVFYGTIHINKSGTSGSPIKIGAYGAGDKPVITSMVEVKQWRSIGGGKYEAKVPNGDGRVAVLLMNNQRQELGRYPNFNKEDEGYLVIESVSGNTIKGQGISGSPNWKGAEVVIKKNPWIIDNQVITSHTGSSLSSKNGSTYPSIKNWGFFIQNHIGTLDQEGEWYYNPSTKMMTVYLGSKNPSSYKFEASTKDNLLTKTYGASHIHINNVHFKGSNSHAIYITGGQGIQLDNVEIEKAGEDGIHSLSVLSFVMQNSKVKDTYNNGISLNYGNVGAIVRDNVIENIGTVVGRNSNGDGNNIGIVAKTNNTLIERNVVRNTGYSGIHFGGNNTVVKNNFIENVLLVKADGGGIYSYDGSATSKFANRKVIDNIVLNAVGSLGGTPQLEVNHRPLAEGIFLDDNSSGIEVSGNTVAHATNNTMKMSNVSDIVVKDNTFFDAGSLITIGNNGIGRDTRNVSIKNNIFFSKNPDQNSYRIATDKDDVKQLGDFNQNYFFRPFGDEFSIYSRYQASERVEREDDLKRWQTLYGKDKDSKSLNLDIPKFKVTKQAGKELFSNGSFNTSIKGINPSGGSASWLAKKIDGGSLQMVAGEKSSLLIEVGSIKKGKAYLVEFKASANKSSAIRTFFRYHKSPWSQISASTTFNLNSSVSSFQTILVPYEDVDAAVLIISSVDPNFTYWMDDIQIKEVEVEKKEVESKILFEYNASLSPKTVTLPGTYVDAKNKKYTGSITIPSFGSVVLVEISSNRDKEAVKAVNPEIQLSIPTNKTSFEEGESIGLKANVQANGASIKKVNFYNGVTLIGSSSGSPYEVIWKNVPKGDHYVWASAIGENGKEVSSNEIDINVLSAKTVVPEVDNAPASKDGVTGLYFNTTVAGSYTYKGMEFGGLPSEFLVTSGTNVSTNTGASKDKLFQKGRFAGTLVYSIPVPNGTYTVQTYHMESYFGQNGRPQKAGQRVFDIMLEGKVVKKDFDMFLETGNKEVVTKFTNIEVKDGVLNLEMVASANNAVISGIAIVGGGKKEMPIKIEAPAEALYFNTTVTGSYTYKGIEFSRLPSEYLVTSGTNVSTNTAASKDKLFQKGRFAGTLVYSIPVPNGTYTVETYHMESYFGQNGRPQKAGQRVFDIVLEGKVVKKDFDMFLETRNKEAVMTFSNIQVKDGVLNLEMSASANNAVISAIAIKPTSSGSANLRSSAEVEIEVEQQEKLEEDNNEILLYPNPAASQTTLAVNVEVSSILVHNLSGQLINNFDPQILRSGQGKYIIPLHNMPQGLYLVTLVGNKGIIEQLKLLVNS